MNGIKYKFIKYQERINKPLYKYFSNYEYVKDCIENKRIYLSTPDKFNDIYDSTFVVTINDLDRLCNTGKNMLAWVERALNRDNKGIIKYEDYSSDFDKCKNLKQVVELCQRYYPELNYDALLKNFVTVLGLNKLIQVDNNKVCCFSETALSILMWSYYANNHSGVCLMFDFNDDQVLASNCHKVQYTDFYLTDIGSYCNYFIKSRQWEHEQEWRIVCETKSDYLPYKNNVSIIIGARNDMVTAFNYYELAHKYKLDLYKVETSPNSFNLSLKKEMEKGEFV